MRARRSRSWPGAARWAQATNWSKSPKVWARPSSRRCWARPRVPDDSPYTTGGIGLLGTAPSQEAMEDCDTLFIVGTSFPYIEFCPKPGRRGACRSTSIRSASACAIRWKSGLVGDSRARAGSSASAAETQRRSRVSWRKRRTA